MHEALIQYISRYSSKPLSGPDEELIRETFTPKRLRKNQFLLSEGEICQYAGFIVKGSLKQYVLDSSGKESVLGLFIENWWAGDRESFSNQTPSPYFIEATEATDMLVITADKFNARLKNEPFVNEMMRALTERNALQLLKRVHSAKALSAEERFVELQQKNPEFLQRFPQHTLASYLGMTKETYSRIKSEQARK